MRRESNKLKEGLNSLKGVCLRSFPEFLADIKMAGLPKIGPPMLDIGTGIADFTLTVSQGLLAFKIARLIFHQAVQYVERIPDPQEAVGAVWLSLGDWNWRIGDGMPITKSDLGPGDEQIIIEHFMCMSFLLTPRFSLLTFSQLIVNTIYASLSSIFKS